MGFAFLEVEVGGAGLLAGTFGLLFCAQALKTTARQTTIQLNIFMILQFTTTYDIVTMHRC